FLPHVFESMQGEARKFSVHDESGAFLPAIREAYEKKNDPKQFNYVLVDPAEYGASSDAARDDMKSAVEKGDLFAFAVIGKNVVEDGSGCAYYSKNLADTDLQGWIADTVSRAAQKRRLELASLDQAVVDRATRRVDFEAFSVGAAGEEKKVGGTERVGA